MTGYFLTCGRAPGARGGRHRAVLAGGVLALVPAEHADPVLRAEVLAEDGEVEVHAGRASKK